VQDFTPDLMSPTFKANPYPTYAYLRENQPVARFETPDAPPMWLITRYDEASRILKDPRFVKNYRMVMSAEQLAMLPEIPSLIQPLTRTMLDLDAPDHTRLRGLVHKAFTPSLVEQMRARVQEIADSLIDAVQDKGQMDVIADFAFPLPITVIAEILGVPAADRDKFRVWSKTIVDGDFGRDLETVVPHIVSFSDYLRAQFEERRRFPKNDLITALLQAEEQGDKLNEEELLSMVFLLLIAGHETTVNLIGNGLLLLLRHPDQLTRLRAEPGLLRTAIEEMLRCESPIEIATERYAREDIEIAGVTIPRGELVLVGLSAANRDPAQFENADTFDVTRVENRHLAFGQGVHYCLGAPLARLEGMIAITTLLRRLPHLKLAVEPEALVWRQSLIIRGLEALPVTF
jgi:cytochrome P450